MDFLIGVGVGFVIGWIMFKRPEWATRLIGWIKTRIGSIHG